jgi:hypothetical protein
MSRAGVLPLLSLALALAGCPLPQPLPEYSASTNTPPRILVDEQLGDGAVIFVPSGCVTAPSYVLAARVVDTNTIESIEARWFVNYDFRAAAYNHIWQRDPVGPNADTANLIRTLPTFRFEPYQYLPPLDPGSPSTATYPYSQRGLLHVVELVVSNGFDPLLDDTLAPRANRSPQAPRFETQFHRWVFLNVEPSTSVPCP